MSVTAPAKPAVLKRRMLAAIPAPVRDAFAEKYDLDGDRKTPLARIEPEKKNLPTGGRWLPGCTSNTESYIHPQFGWMETRMKGKQ